MLMLSFSKETEKPAAEIFRRIDNIHKVLEFEKEIKEFRIEQGNEKKGIAFIKVKIFGKEINGKMNYEIAAGRMTGTLESNDIKYLKFGYMVKALGTGSVVTQFVKFDAGSLRNLFVKLFLSKMIKNHMEKEVLEVTK